MNATGEKRTGEQMAQIGASVAMRFTRYDLRNADERIAEVKEHVDRERTLLNRLQPQSNEANRVRQVVSAMERTLRQFQEHRRRIKDELTYAEGSERD
jgi:transposase